MRASNEAKGGRPGAAWSELSGGLSAEGRTALFLAPVLLTLHRYLMAPNVFRRLFSGFTSDPLFNVYAYAWRYLGSAVFLCLVPWLIWRLVWKRRFQDLGARLGDPKKASLILPAAVGMVLVVAAVSFLPDFQNKYPLLKDARTRLDMFLAYELMYGVYFFMWEFFFRGWMLRSLERDFGAGAVWIQTIPFVLMHFGKPLPETLGSAPAGLFLGWISYRSGSFLYGWLLHWAIAFFMDVSVSLQIHL